MASQYPLRLLHKPLGRSPSTNRFVSSLHQLGSGTTRSLSKRSSPLGARRISTSPWNRLPAASPLSRESPESRRPSSPATSLGEDANAGKGLTWSEAGISVTLPTKKEYRNFHAPNFWLRDHCRCEKCVNQDTMQRAFDTFQISPRVTAKEAVSEEDGLRVTWQHDGISEEHSSLYPWEWLIKQSRLNRKVVSTQDHPKYSLWGKEIISEEPIVHYDQIMADESGVGEWTAKIRKYGFCYVEGCPVSPEKTQELLERIAFIRVTHYGGFYDFTSDLTMKDMAYTSLALGAHTDTTYFTDPAGLQMFHLLSHTEGEGGASLLVDGFNAAYRLRQESPEAWNILASVPILWHASGNEGITITPSHGFPVLNINKNTGSPHGIQNLLQIRWNNDDRGLVPIRQNVKTGLSEWYEAARTFDEIIKRDDMQYWAQMRPGRPLIFDNWRVMHGRSAFTGKRRICGGYINHDDFMSRWRNTNFSRKEALSQLL